MLTNNISAARTMVWCQIPLGIGESAASKWCSTNLLYPLFIQVALKMKERLKIWAQTMKLFRHWWVLALVVALVQSMGKLLCRLQRWDGWRDWDNRDDKNNKLEICFAQFFEQVFLVEIGPDSMYLLFWYTRMKMSSSDHVDGAQHISQVELNLSWYVTTGLQYYFVWKALSWAVYNMIKKLTKYTSK